MLFHSYAYLFAFLPATVVGFVIVSGRKGPAAAMLWLVAASLLFYAWSSPAYVLLLALSALGTYVCSLAGARSPRRKKAWLVAGIAFNLLVLGYFKYAHFFLQTLGELGLRHGLTVSVVLPLGISFITFRNIAYLVDAHRREDARLGFLPYCFFVTFFPQLIAGPIVRSGEIAPQLAGGQALRLRESNLAVGLTIFVIGLWKKAVCADALAPYADALFAAADAGVPVDFLEAWLGALAYTLQLYFDFSGYADMAIGSARIFGIHLPVNFLSPYKSQSIIEFWRTWHITLSNFLRDYLYIPLGGSRKGTMRKHVNLFLTMLLGGLWHGAGWTFLFWGALHGIYLVTNHLWRSLRLPFPRFLSWPLTFLCTIVAWVFFRATTFAGAWNILAGMAGARGIALPGSLLPRLGAFGAWMQAHGFRFDLTDAMVLRPDAFVHAALWIGALLLFVLLAPNTQEFLGKHLPVINPEKHPPPPRKTFFQWSPTTAYAGLSALLSFASFASLSILQNTEFLYFRF